jgi:hypothetical protein
MLGHLIFPAKGWYSYDFGVFFWVNFSVLKSGKDKNEGKKKSDKYRS